MFGELENKTILVTGGAGFIGSNLIGVLLKNFAKVICFDNFSTGKEGNIAEFGIHKNFTLVKGDANSHDDLKKVFDDNQIDYVFHYAAKVGVVRTIEDPVGVLEDIQGIRNVLELAKNNKVKKVMFSSSSEVYGEPIELPEKETGPINAKMPYAVVKSVGENYMKSYFQKFGLKTCSLRFFNVYGPKQDSSSYGFVIGIFIEQALNGGPITVFNTGEQTRDFVYIEDNVNMSLLALLTDKTNGEVINVGVGRPITILELAKRVVALSKNKNLKIDFCESRKEGEIKFRYPDIDKMQKLINYNPIYNIESGLEKTFYWYENKNK